MTDPEEQLRRLADHRADSVGPFEPEHESAEVIAFPLRRRIAAVAAAVVVVAGVGFSVRELGDGTDADDMFEEVVVAADDEADTTVTGSTSPPSTTLRDVIVPDVVGSNAEAAVEAMEEAGLEVRTTPLFVAPDDDRIGEVAGQAFEAGDIVKDGSEIVLLIARIASPATNVSSRCSRSPYDSADLDGDGRADGVFPRWAGAQIVEIEVCTADGLPLVVGALSVDRIEQLVDFDLDGQAEIVAAVGDGTRSVVVSVVGDTLVAVEGELSYGESLDGPVSWWGCVSFEVGEAEKLAVGDWTTTAGGDVEWQVTETLIVDGQFDTGRTRFGVTPSSDLAGDETGGLGRLGRDRCVPAVIENPCVDASALVGDVDGDGELDVVAPRDNVVCLANGVVAAIGAPADRVGTWFLGDIEGDGRMEVFLGTTAAPSMSVRSWSVDETGLFTPAAAEGCCEQWVPEWSIFPDLAPRWFSCLAPIEDEPGRLVGGRFWVDTATSTVRWTVDDGDGDDREYSLVVADPAATDAWMPGNGCRGSAFGGAVRFADDGTSLPEDLAAISDWMADNDPSRVRRFAMLRDALDIAETMTEASGPYLENVELGYIELHGLLDDSVGALRWDFLFSDDGAEVTELTRTWACGAGRGHQDFSTEVCV